jgi:hypothetical protein
MKLKKIKGIKEFIYFFFLDADAAGCCGKLGCCWNGTPYIGGC